MIPKTQDTTELEMVVEEILSLIPKMQVVVNVGEGETDMIDLEEALPPDLKKLVTTYAQTVAEEAVRGVNLIAMGMQAENMQRQALGQSMAYTEEDFIALTNQS